LIRINAARRHPVIDGQRRIGAQAMEDAMTRSPSIFTAGLLAGLTALAAPAAAASCWDLWYERNAIYDRNGYCFSTSLGKRTFNNADCWTKNPDLSNWEHKRVAQIKAEERRRGCKVNN
jgi:hypothetical protein